MASPRKDAHPTPRTVSRRRLLQSVGTAAGFTVLRSAGAAAAQGDQTPTEGGTLIYAMASEPDCYDPQISAADACHLIARQIVDSLLAQAPDGTFKPWLAASYEVSSDAKQFTFKLRNGISFSDGTPFNADAVKVNFDRIANPKTGSQYAISLLGPYRSTDVLDPLTVRVNFSTGFSPFLQAVSQPMLGMQSPKALTSAASCAPPVGTGAFIAGTPQAQQGITLRRNPKYTSPSPLAKHTGPAHLDTLDIRFIPDDGVRTGSLTSGQVNVADTIPTQEVANLKSGGMQILEMGNPGAPYQLFLNTSRPPFNDVRVRQAFQRSLNIDGIVKALYSGQYPRAWSPITPTTFGYDKSLEGSWPQDVDKAKALLDQAGWTQNGDFRQKNGQSLVARWPQPGTTREQRGSVAQLIKEQAQAVGIDVQIQQVGLPPYLAAIQQNQYDIGDFSFVRSDPDILRNLFDSSNQPTPQRIAQNFARLSNPQIDSWLRQAAQTVDPNTRKQLYARVQHAVIDMAVAVPIYVPTTIIATQESVHGIRLGSQANPVYYDAWIEG